MESSKKYLSKNGKMGRGANCEFTYIFLFFIKGQRYYFYCCYYIL